MLALLLLPLLQANSIPVQSGHILEVGEEVHFGFGGAWARVFPNEPESDFFYGAGGDFWHNTMDKNFFIEEESQVAMTGRFDLDDHSMVPCPDGSYLHVASARTGEANDSAYSFRYDAQFERQSSAILAQQDAAVRFNDMAVICHEKGRFASFIDYDVWGAVVYILDEDGGMVERRRIQELPLPEGGTMLEDPRTGDLALGTSTPPKDGLFVNRLDWDLGFKETKRILTVDRSQTQSYWPQAVRVIEDRIVVAYVQQPVNQGFVADWGNIWLAIFDDEWRLLENHQITTDEAPDGTMRPGLALVDDLLMLTYDEMQEHPPGIVEPRLVPITLNLEAFKSPITDSGDSAGDSGDEPVVDPEPSSCSCASQGEASPSPAWFLFLGLLGFRRRSTR